MFTHRIGTASMLLALPFLLTAVLTGTRVIPPAHASASATLLRETTTTSDIRQRVVSADTIVARSANGSEMRFRTLHCEPTVGGRAFRRLSPGEAGRIVAGPHSLSASPAGLSQDAEITLQQVGDGSNRHVEVLVNPSGAIQNDLLLTLSYRGCNVSRGGDDLRVVNRTRGVELPNPVHDRAAETVTVPVRSFSLFVLVEPV
jgi:hypothetical protein